jgi:multicomponent Na+:H+ antiporter subunit F
MTTIIIIASVILSVAGIMTLIRLLRGPTTLDRIIAIDALLVVIVCQLGVTAAYTKDSTIVPVMIVVSLLGFIGSSSVSTLLFTNRKTNGKS